MEDCDRIFIAVNSAQKGSYSQNPQKSLVRYEFLETLVRCALKKYCEPPQQVTIPEVEAIDILNEEYLEPYRLKVMADNPFYYD